MKFLKKGKTKGTFWKWLTCNIRICATVDTYQFKKTNWAQNFRPPSQCKILPPSSFRKFELISFKQSPKALKSARMYNMSNILDLGRVVLWHNFSSLRPIRFKLILAHDFIVKVAKIQSVFFSYYHLDRIKNL